MSISKIACFLCGSFAGSTFSDVVRHIGYVHACEPHFQVTCGLYGCKRQYRSFGAYRKHLYKAHGDVIKGNVLQVLENPSPCTSSSVGDIDSGGDIIADEDDSNSRDTMVNDESVKRAAALFMLKTVEKHKLPLSSMEGLMHDVQLLITTVLDRVTTKSAEVLSTRDMELLCDTMRDESVVDPFIGLHSTYQQTKYYKEHLGLIEPVERVLGWKWQTSSSNGHISRTPDTCYDVPLLLSLQCLLQKSSVLEQIFNPHCLHDGLLGDYCDGEQFKSHPLFGCDPYALQIILYYDEVELCNPLGSYTKKHKLGLFYYLLGNIHPRLRAGLNTIQLLCAVKSQYINEYGMDEILRPFVADIQKLEKDEGVEFDTADGLKYFRGSLSVCSADNLASYELGGFKNLTGALRKCRICQATREDMSSKFTAEQFQQRSRSLHKEQCQRIKEATPSALQDHFATTYGIKCDSILNTLRYFHVVDGLPPDAMHDLLEGVLQYEMKQLLLYCTESRFFSLELLNSRIQNFLYGSSEASNRPSKISATTLCASDNSLKQSASQMWCLGRFLPLLIGDKVLEDDERWRNFLLLLDIVDRVLAPVCNMSVVADLRHLIHIHHLEFKRLYPEKTITPKMHFLVHYPEMIARFGPLSRMWCMRFEAKNSYFKKISQSIGNFKNIAKTVSTRHQRMSCYNLAGESINFTQDTLTGPASTISLDALPYADQIPDISITHKYAWIKVGGSCYKAGSIVIRQMHDDCPQFCRIVDVVADKVGTFFFIVTVLPPPEYSGHYHAYIVTKASNHRDICNPEQLCDYHSYSLHQSYDTSLISVYFVVPKYYII